MAAIALWLASYALWRGNRNTSAATLVTLNDGFRQGWERYFAAEPAAQAYALGDLLNLFEVACGILHEGSLAGVSKDIADDYLRSVLSHLERDDILPQIAALREAPETFAYIRKFISKPREFRQHEKLRQALATAVASGTAESAGKCLS